MVVYKEGKPDRKSYRKFKIKESNQTNEFAHTQEVIRRRYSRLLREEQPLPNLILMDGGKVQIRAARQVIEEELGLSIPVAGMVKDDKHRTASLMNGYSEEVVELDRQSPVFHYIQRIQEEVHRYAISYHRQVRSKQQFASKLDAIPGVGKVTRTKLLKHFKSLKAMKEASIEDYAKLGVRAELAERIIAYLSK